MYRQLTQLHCTSTARHWNSDTEKVREHEIQWDEFSLPELQLVSYDKQS